MYHDEIIYHDVFWCHFVLQETDDVNCGKRARASALLKRTDVKLHISSKSPANPMLNGAHSKVRSSLPASGLPISQLRSSNWAEPEFLTQLHHFMCRRGTPITRLPTWSGKKCASTICMIILLFVDLYTLSCVNCRLIVCLFTVNVCFLYRSVQKLGGYTAVSECRLWRKVHDMLGGDKEPALAAAATRRCYER